METNYASNSFKSKKEEKKSVEKKKVQKVVSGKVITKKQTGVRKLANLFRPDDIASVKERIVEDVIIPKTKDVLLDTVTMILYGKTRRGGGPGIPATRTSYSSYFNGSQRDSTVSRQRTKSYMDIILDDRGDAEAVLDGLDDLMKAYGKASIADLYELAGESYEYTDNNYGWYDLRTANVVRVPEGYLVKLPKAVPLK